MEIAIFDLDNTLISGDSDYEWGQYLIGLGLVDAEHHARENQRFFDHYKAGTLDIHEYARFAFKPFTEHPLQDLLRWRDAFLAERINPIVRHKAVSLVHQHRQAGHELMIITSTNRFLAQPIAELFGVNNVIATEIAMKDGAFTNCIAGEPSLGAGKVIRLQKWLSDAGHQPEMSWAYSDSHNDIPLLEWAKEAVAVDPDATLTAYAQRRGWEIISLL